MQALQMIKQLPAKAFVSLASGYLVLVNAGAAGLFWYDKRQAQTRGWRVPEATLQASALMGGWIGGFWAMNRFRHKTSKQTFLLPYYGCVAANVGLLGTVFYGRQGGLNDPTLQRLADQAQRHLKNVKPRF